jgi:hypothetical protein
MKPIPCPCCNTSTRIVAFVQNPVEIKKIMQSLRLPDFTAPPPLPRLATIAPFADYNPEYDA